MSLGTFNKRYEITVQAYKESEPIRLEGGIQRRTTTAPINLKILFMHKGIRAKRRLNGEVYVEDSFVFQVSSEEINEKSFEIEEGKTLIIYDSNHYRVRFVKDYRMYRFTSAIQCTAVRIINS